MSHVNGFLSTILPDVWTKNFSARSEDDMGTGMMSLQLLSSIAIDGHIGFLSFEVFSVSLEWSVKNM
jgi:hypothetical protein